MAVVNQRAVRFRGPPSSMTAMLIGTGELPSPLAVRVKLPGLDEEEYPAEVSPDVGRVRLYLTVPRPTPPGRYEGRIAYLKTQLPAVLEVEPEPELDVEPGSVRLIAGAGESIPLEFTIYNPGNVGVTIRGAYLFGLFPDEGAERAILQSHTAKEEGARRLDVLVDALAEEFAGAVRVKVEEGGGTIEPGQAREVRLNLVMPQGLRPGRSYDGTFELDGSSCYVRVDVPEAVRETIR